MFRVHVTNFENSLRMLYLTTVHYNSFKNSKQIVTILIPVDFVKIDPGRMVLFIDAPG